METITLQSSDLQSGIIAQVGIGPMMCYLLLASYANEDGVASPGVSKLMSVLGIRDRKTVIRHLNTLENERLVERVSVQGIRNTCYAIIGDMWKNATRVEKCHSCGKMPLLKWENATSKVGKCHMKPPLVDPGFPPSYSPLSLSVSYVYSEKEKSAHHDSASRNRDISLPEPRPKEEEEPDRDTEKKPAPQGTSQNRTRSRKSTQEAKEAPNKGMDTSRHVAAPSAASNKRASSKRKYEPIDVELVNRFESKLQALYPEWKLAGDREMHYDVMRKLRTLGGPNIGGKQSAESIRSVIDWLGANEDRDAQFWWPSNIQSIAKFRKQFSRLLPQMKLATGGRSIDNGKGTDQKRKERAERSQFKMWGTE